MFADYLFAKEPTLPPLPSCLYQYVVAANGLFVRAERPGLSALVPLHRLDGVRGLQSLQPYVRIRPVPEHMVKGIFQTAVKYIGREILYYFRMETDGWRASAPQQVQSAGSVTPVDPYAAGENTLIELHSHHRMAAYFSSTDNREEQGFRVYAVIGGLDSAPSIRVRVGIYGHFWQCPASWVFCLPSGVRDSALVVR